MACGIRDIKILHPAKNIFQCVNGRADRTTLSRESLPSNDKIGLQHITMTYGVDDAVPQIWIDGKQIPIEIVAKNDGLTVEQFVEWFFGESKSNVFEGVVLHFTSFRY